MYFPGLMPANLNRPSSSVLVLATTVESFKFFIRIEAKITGFLSFASKTKPVTAVCFCALAMKKVNRKKIKVKYLVIRALFGLGLMTVKLLKGLRA